MPAPLDVSYDEYPQIEEAFQAALDESLDPAGPSSLFEVVAALGLPPGSRAVDVGCGEGYHAGVLVEQLGLRVVGVDPVQRQVAVASRATPAAAFAVGSAEALPLGDSTVELVWCRDVLVHVEDLDAAYAEMRRVLVPGGYAVVHQSSFLPETSVGTSAPALVDASLLAPLAVRLANTDPARTDAAIAAAGFRVVERLEVGVEWAEWVEEHSAAKSRRLLHLARLLRAPDGYVARFGRPAYEIMRADCYWHVLHMIGLLSIRVHVLRAPGGDLSSCRAADPSD